MTYALEGPRWATSTITWDFGATTLPGDQAEPFTNVINQPDARLVVTQAMEAWSRAGNVQFVYVPQDSATTDIRIGWGTFGASTADGSTIGETNYSYSPSTNRFESDVVVRLDDPARLPLYDNAGTLSYNDPDHTTLLQITLHEIGHALGLAHDADDPDAIMYPYVSGSNLQLDGQDIQGIQAIYGPPASDLVNIGENQETLSGALSGAPTTVLGGSGVLDYAGGLGLIMLDDGSARIHDGSVTVFAGAAQVIAYDNQSGEFILGSSYSGISGGLAGSTDVVFGGSGNFAYAGSEETATVIGGSGSATITGGAGGGYYQGGSDGSNSLPATGIGTVLVGGGNNDTLVAAGAGYSYLVAGSGNETLIGSLGGGSAGTDRFYLGSGADAVGLGTGEAQLVTGTGTATIYGGGGAADIFGGTGGADLFVERPGSTMDVFNFRQGVDHISGTPTATSVGPGFGSGVLATTLSFADGATILLDNVSDPSGAGLS